ncbi:hypothetical protein MP228_009787 [Amoeboaphelidium protococcarum]|nr:hypothetical protein MP228_009787 [Amoeboaphelidium protococcarum]
MTDNTSEDCKPKQTAIYSSNQSDADISESTANSANQHLADNLLLMEFQLLNQLGQGGSNNGNSGEQVDSQQQSQSSIASSPRMSTVTAPKPAAAHKSPQPKRGQVPISFYQSHLPVSSYKQHVKSNGSAQGNVIEIRTIDTGSGTRKKGGKQQQQQGIWRRRYLIAQNKLHRFKREVYITWQKRISLAQKRGCLVAVIVLLMAGLICALILTLPRCNLLGCKRDFVYEDIMRELRQQNGQQSSVILDADRLYQYPQSAELVQQVLSVSDYEGNQNQIQLLVHSNWTNHDQSVVPIVSSSLDVPDLPKAANVGPLTCGKLGPFNQVLGFVPAYTRDSMPLQRGDNIDLTDFDYSTLADCCVQFYTLHNGWYVRNRDIHARITCFHSGRNIMWKGVSSMKLNHNQTFTEQVKTGYQTNTRDRDQVSMVTALSGSTRFEDGGYMRGVSAYGKVDVSVDAVGNATRYLTNVKSKWLSGVAFIHMAMNMSSVSTNLITNTSTMWINLDHTQLSLQTIVPISDLDLNVDSNALQWNQKSVNILIRNLNQFEALSDGRSYIPVQSGGCPQKYTDTGISCVSDASAEQLQVRVEQKMQMVQTDQGQKFYPTVVTNLKFYTEQMNGEGGVTMPAKSMPVVLIFQHALLNRTGFWHNRLTKSGPFAFLMEDGSCPNYQKINPSWDLSFKESPWRWLNVKTQFINDRSVLNPQSQIDIDGVNQREMVYLTSCRLGDITLAMNEGDLEDLEPLLLKVVFPNCPSCPQYDWIRLNPPMNSLENSLWSKQADWRQSRDVVVQSMMYLSNLAQFQFNQVKAVKDALPGMAQEQFNVVVGKQSRAMADTHLQLDESSSSSADSARSSSYLTNLLLLSTPLTSNRIKDSQWKDSPRGSLDLFTLDISSSNPDIYFYLQSITSQLNDTVNSMRQLLSQRSGTSDISVADHCVHLSRQYSEYISTLRGDGVGVQLLGDLSYAEMVRIDGVSHQLYQLLVNSISPLSAMMVQILEKFLQDTTALRLPLMPWSLQDLINKEYRGQLKRSGWNVNQPTVGMLLQLIAAEDFTSVIDQKMKVYSNGTEVDRSRRNRQWRHPLIMLVSNSTTTAEKSYTYCFGAQQECLPYSDASARVRSQLSDVQRRLISTMDLFNISPQELPYDVSDMVDSFEYRSSYNQWITFTFVKMMHLTSTMSIEDLIIHPHWLLSIIELHLVGGVNQFSTRLSSKELASVKWLLSMQLIKTEESHYWRAVGSQLMAEAAVQLLEFKN